MSKKVDWKARCAEHCGTIGKRDATITKLEAQLDEQTMMLAACSTVAYANTPKSANLARDMQPDYMCAAVSDVCLAVDREMKLIAQLDKVRELKSHSIETIVDLDRCNPQMARSRWVLAECELAEDTYRTLKQALENE